MALPSHEKLLTAVPATAPVAGPPANDHERRRTPRRRVRDRIASHDATENPTLRARHELKNLVMLVDDDLRQTALSLGAIEAWLTRAATLLETYGVRGSDLAAHAEDDDLGTRLDVLSENLDDLRRRMLQVADVIGG